MLRGALGVLAGLAVCGSSSAGPPLLELTVGDEAFIGATLAHDDDVCWLLQPDGRLAEVSLESVTSFRKVADEFRSLSALQMRNELRKQLGNDWEIVGTGHYLVCAKHGRARIYADEFEDVYRSVRVFFSRRKFELPEPEFPLVAIIFSEAQEYADRCRQDGLPPIRGLRGYYHLKTNQTCMLENGEEFVSIEAGSPALPRGMTSGIPPTLKNTIVHEGTHQVAFNLGLHSRLGSPPRWIVEGLGTMFEADGTRNNTGGRPARERVNAERLEWFGEYSTERRPPGALGRFIATEEAYAKAPLDFYAEAWALTFFLAETRPHEYAAYLKAVADRDPLKRYTALDRISDFQSAFGADIGRIEVEMLRFIDGLQP